MLSLPRLAALDVVGLTALVEFADGYTPEEIATIHGLDRLDVEQLLRSGSGDLVMALRTAPVDADGRGVLSEKRARSGLLDQTAQDTPELWRQMRDQLRQTETAMSSAERDLFWSRQDRLEELIERLPADLRDDVYRHLTAAGLTELSTIDAAHTDSLRAAGLTIKQIKALWDALPDRPLDDRPALAQNTLPQRTGLVSTTTFGPNRLVLALALAAGLDVSSGIPTSPEMVEALRDRLGLTRLGALLRGVDLPMTDDPHYVETLLAVAGVAPVSRLDVSSVDRTIALMMLDRFVMSRFPMPDRPKRAAATDPPSAPATAPRRVHGLVVFGVTGIAAAAAGGGSALAGAVGGATALVVGLLVATLTVATVRPVRT
ncbi:MAG: hypothetical protein ACRD0H_06910, partial [Actinomycetes bacterium]